MDRGKCRSTYFGFCDEDDVDITCLVKRILRSFAMYGCAEQLNLPMGRTKGSCAKDGSRALSCTLGDLPHTQMGVISFACDNL